MDLPLYFYRMYTGIWKEEPIEGQRGEPDEALEFQNWEFAPDKTNFDEVPDVCEEKRTI